MGPQSIAYNCGIDVADGEPTKTLFRVTVGRRSRVYWKQDGQYDQQHWREDFEEHAKVANEEVCVQSTFLNKLETGSRKDGLYPANYSMGRYRDALSFGHEVSPRAVDAYQAPSEEDENQYLDKGCGQRDGYCGPEGIPSLRTITSVGGAGVANKPGIKGRCVDIFGVRGRIRRHFAGEGCSVVGGGVSPWPAVEEGEHRSAAWLR